MILPNDTNFPFFSYGIFKPGELVFFRIWEFVKNIDRNCSINSTLLIRDGLPIIDSEENGQVYGVLIYFKKNRAIEAYQRIIEIEPDKHYRWGKIEVLNKNNKKFFANVLLGKSPKRGSVHQDNFYFEGRKDPLFNDAFDVIKEVINNCENYEGEKSRFFKLQMAYLLLWTIIERYVTIRYHLGGNNIMQKIHELGNDELFCKELSKIKVEKRHIIRSDQPRTKVTLDYNDPKKSLDYYYQIRSNIVHRGKAAYDDHRMLYRSTVELFGIMEKTIHNAFSESENIYARRRLFNRHSEST